MSEYVVELGGAKRKLIYTLKERRELEKRFSCGLLELLQKKVLPTIEVEGKTIATGGGELDAQLTVLFMGLRHGGKALTEEKVEEWVQEGVGKGAHIIEYLVPACGAVWASGVLGRVIDIQAQQEEEGKGQAEPAPA